MYKKGAIDSQQVQMPTPAGYGARMNFDVGEFGIGLGPTVLRRRMSATLLSLPAVDQPPAGGAVRKNFVARHLPLDAFVTVGTDQDPSRQMRKFKTPPAYFLSRALRGITYDENSVIVPFATVHLRRTDTNALIATTVSDAAGNYYFTVPE